MSKRKTNLQKEMGDLPKGRLSNYSIEAMTPDQYAAAVLQSDGPPKKRRVTNAELEAKRK